MNLYLIRHALPDYENDSITELGKTQAAALFKTKNVILMASAGVMILYPKMKFSFRIMISIARLWILFCLIMDIKEKISFIKQ